jgi:hypothetical protein
MRTIGDPGRTRRLQDFGPLKSNIIIIIPEILTPIIILSHTCPESASNNLEIIDSISARSPQNRNDRRSCKNKKITRFTTSEINGTHGHTRDINAYNHSLS